MILTASAITAAHARGEIILEPYSIDLLNPNSYNYRLGSKLLVISAERDAVQSTPTVDIPVDGFVLEPRTLYLGCTHERIGSSQYVMTLLGRSSLGRLGMFLNVTADLGHRGAVSHWTLEITVVQRLRVYSQMIVGQVAFWRDVGASSLYDGQYQNDCMPSANRDPNLMQPPSPNWKKRE